MEITLFVLGAVSIHFLLLLLRIKKWEVKMRQLITCLNVLLLAGCSQVLYEPMVFDGEKINKDSLIEIAQNEENIIDYAQCLYSNEPEESSDSQVLIGSVLVPVEDFNQDSNLSSYIDTKFIATYCDSRGGNVLNWIIDKNYEHMRSGQVRKELYTCEIDDVVDAALLYDIKFNGKFVKIEKTYMTNEKFEEFRKYYLQLETHDGKIAIDKSSLYDPVNGSKCKTCSNAFFVDLSKKEESGQFDDVKNISIIIGDEVHDVIIKNIESINIDIYDYNSFEKGIEHKEEIAVKIKGKKEFKAEDVLDSVIVIDGHEYSNFKEVDPYQRDKHTLRVVPEYLAFE